MHRRQALKIFAGLTLCPLCGAKSFGEETHVGHHWSYEGATGPDKWGSLDAANATCASGAQQSPVDLSGPVSARQPALDIGWKTRPDTIVNNGHTIQLNQFHFHHPSEHRVDGKPFAMEAHFVHAGKGGRLAVVGVFMVPGRANAVFNKIVSTMPAEEGPPIPADPAIDPTRLLPARQS